MNFRVSYFASFILVLLFENLLQAQPDSVLKGASRPRPQMSLDNRDRQYKRVHQFALRLILRMHFERAKSFLEGHLSDFPEDAETHFLMGIWNARQGKIEPAVAWFEKAIELGLPPSRVMAARDLTRNIAAHPFFESLKDAYEDSLLHGPLIGNVSDHSASFWVRTASQSEIRIIASASKNFTDRLIFGRGKTRPEADFTGIIHLNGLEADTNYFYKIEVNGKEFRKEISKEFQDHDLHFKTFPQKGQPSKFRLAFGGGAGFVPNHERVWIRISSFSPQLLLLLGDNVYIDDPRSLIMQRFTYHRRQSRPEWHHLVSRVSVFTIWDDHDFGTNDCWGGPHVDEPFWKRHFAFRTFRENWANPSYAKGDSLPGCWYDFSVGDVDFIMLDCRYYRTNPKGKIPQCSVQPKCIGSKKGSSLLGQPSKSSAHQSLLIFAQREKVLTLGTDFEMSAKSFFPSLIKIILKVFC